MPPDRRVVSASPAASSSAPSPPTPSEETPLLLAAARTTDLENGVPRTSASASSPPPSSLPSSASKSPSHDNKDTSSSSTTPFPRNQIMLLCYARMTEPIAFFSIFPFIAAMVARNGSLPSSDVGLYSGVIESVFSLVQTLVLMPWSRLADRIGRKPALVLSLCGTAVCPALFGLATSIPQMLAFRCLAGLFSASGLIIRTMIAEKTTTTTTTNTISPSSSSSEEGHHHHHHQQQQQQQQALAFSWFAFAGNVGILLGPIVGGALAEPALQYPRFFGRSRFLAAYPYALPGFAVAAVSASAAIVALVYLEETLPPAKTRCKPAATTTTTNKHPTNHNDNDITHHRGADAAAAAAGQEEAPQIDDSNDSSSTHHDSASAEAAGAEAAEAAAAAMTTWQLIKAPGVAAALWIYSHVMFLAFAFTAILPVALYTPVDIGGLGLSSVQISAYMAAQGASQALWLLLAFPLLQRRLGTRGVLYACALVYPLFFVGYILMNLLLRDGSGPAMAWFWIIGPLVALVGPGVSMAFTGVQLALNDAAPAVHLLGTLNAIALTCTGAIRSVVPGAATALYAVGVRNQIVWGHLAWLILLPIAMALFFCLKWLRSST